MNFFSDFYRTAVGKKAVMALTGIALYGYVLLHMLGNLKYFQGADKLNEYGVWLREMGTPALPYATALWVVRVILIVSLALHVVAAVQLTIKNWQARPVAYHRHTWQESTFASRTMRWTGLLLLAFILYHLLHLTYGTAHHDFRHGDVYHNVVSGFEIWWVAAVYILAQVVLGLHLFHGMWSLFQSLGWNHPRFNHWRRYFAWVSAFLIAAGNIAIPVAVLLRK